MELDQFLEKDILSFLEGKIERKNKGGLDREEEYGLYLTKDYMKELIAALDNDELTKAKRLFDELKQSYSKIPKNSLERKKVYNLLEQMYEKIESYVRVRSTPGIDITTSSNPVSLVTTTLTDVSAKSSQPVQSTQSAADKSKDTADLDTKGKIIEKQFGSLDKEFNKQSRSINIETLQRSKQVEKASQVMPSIIIAGISSNTDLINIDEEHFDHAKKSKDNLLSDKYPENRPIEIFKIPKITQAEVSKLKTPLIIATENSIIKQKKTKESHTEKSMIPVSIVSVPDQEISEKKLDEFQVYKIPHSVDAQDMQSKKEEETEDNKDENIGTTTSAEQYLGPKTIEMYKISNQQAINEVHTKELSKESSNGSSEDVLSSHNLELKRLEGFEQVDKIYFEGIYLFYNHNYQDASKLFEKVISLRPKSKAAKIRLQECKEAIESG